MQLTGRALEKSIEVKLIRQVWFRSLPPGMVQVLAQFKWGLLHNEQLKVPAVRVRRTGILEIQGRFLFSRLFRNLLGRGSATLRDTQGADSAGSRDVKAFGSNISSESSAQLSKASKKSHLFLQVVSQKMDRLSPLTTVTGSFWAISL